MFEQQLEEVRVVGSFKKGTMLRGYNTADMVVILKTLPTHEAVKSLGTKILDDLQKLQTEQTCGVEFNDRGFNISSDSKNGGERAVVRVLITTVGKHQSLLSIVLHICTKIKII